MPITVAGLPFRRMVLPITDGSAPNWRCQKPSSRTTTGSAAGASSRTGSSSLPSRGVAPSSVKKFAVTKLASICFSSPSTARSRRRFARESECGIRRTWHGQQCGAQAQGRGPRAAHSQHAARAHLFGCTSLGFHGLLPPVGCRRVPSARRAGQGSAGRQSHGSGPGRQPGSGRGTPPPSGNLVCRMGGNGLVVPTLLTKLYTLLIAAASSLQSPFLLLVRLYWGFQMMQTGWGKLHNLAKVTEFFTSLGIPLPGLNAPFIVGLEFLGGILIMLGLGSRLVALLLTCDMVVAFITADREALFSIFSDPDKFYAAAPYTFLVAFLIVLIFGPGRFSLDALLTKRLSGAA